jgi:phosphatidylglycerophosphatase A
MAQPSRLTRLVWVGVTSMGVGLLPGPRGTYGSALTLAGAMLWLAWEGAPLEGWPYLLLLLALFLAAVFFSQAAEKHEIYGSHTDPGQIVIDEAVGMLIALYGQMAPMSWWQLGLAFAAFRFFDIAKPWPVNAAQRLPGGWGVVLDDVLAGLYALGAVVLAKWLALA